MVFKRVSILILAMALSGSIFGRQRQETFASQPRTDITQPEFILDAGHGGEDGGAVSLTGVPESEINLEITLKLDSVLGFLGCPSVLTRQEDISIYDEKANTLREKKVSDLKNRVELAQSYPLASLVSIHQNSYPEKQYRGTQVFYAPTERSQELAQVVQQKITGQLQPENTRQEKLISSSVYLMNHVKNRAILIECGFLTNPEEEKLLREDHYQKKLAMVTACALLYRP